MTRGVVAFAAAAVLLGAFAVRDAHAQPGRAPTWQPPPQPRPVQITPEEAELLEQGEISDAQLVAGGLIGTFYGFGIGHLIQQRWMKDGWKFTLGEAVTGAIFLYGFIDCIEEDINRPVDEGCDPEVMIGGMIGFLVFRVWEAVDVWSEPGRHNRRVRALRQRIRYQQQYGQQPRWGLFLAPPKRGTGRGAVAGVTLRF